MVGSVVGSWWGQALDSWICMSAVRSRWTVSWLFALCNTVDELGIWNRVLSTTEISDLYNGGSGQTMN